METRFINTGLTTRLSIATLVLLTLTTVYGSEAHAQNPTLAFVSTMGGTDKEIARGPHAIDANGNTYLTGTFHGTADFDPGPGIANLTTVSEAIFLAKYDATGAYLWAFRIGEASGNTVTDVALAIDGGGNVVVSGPFKGAVDFDPGPSTANITASATGAQFVAKYNTTGNYLWAFALTSSTMVPMVQCVAIDGSGNIVVVGYFFGSVDFNPGAGTAVLRCTKSTNGSPDSYVARYSASGGYLWSFAIRGAKAEWPSRTVVDGNGDIYVTGLFEGSAKFNPANQATLTATGEYDAYVAKYSAAGAYVWAFKTGSTSSDEGTALAVDGSGNLYVTGKFRLTADFDPGSGTANLTSAGDADFYVAKYSTAGAYSWAFRVGAAGSDGNNAIAIDGGGNVLLTGSFGGTIDFDPGAGTAELTNGGVYVAKYTSFGDYVWAFAIDRVTLTSSPAGRWIDTDASGNIYVTGFFSGSIDFDPNGSTVVTSAGDRDIYIAAYSEPVMPKRSVTARARNSNAASLHAAPNPFTGELRVRVDRAVAPTRIEVIDMMGRVVETHATNGETAELVIGADLPPGGYVVRTVGVESCSTVFVRKVK